jgi:hypothetical protein
MRRDCPWTASCSSQPAGVIGDESRGGTLSFRHQRGKMARAFSECPYSGLVSGICDPPQGSRFRGNGWSALGKVLPLDTAVAVVAGEIMALLPHPPTPPLRSHQLRESRQDRLARWRFDTMIAATALVTNMALIHNNAADFESIRSAIERSPQRFPGLGPLQLVRCDSLL